MTRNDYPMANGMFLDTNRVLMDLFDKVNNLETQIKNLSIVQPISDKERAERDKWSTFGVPNKLINLFNDMVVPEDQLDILQEECAELIQACSKVLRSKPNALANLKEEMAHVLISSAMIATMFGITEDDIYLEAQKKQLKFASSTYTGEPKVNRTSLFEKYKQRAIEAYVLKEHKLEYHPISQIEVYKDLANLITIEDAKNREKAGINYETN